MMAEPDHSGLTQPLDDTGMIPVEGPEEVPRFASEAEEHAFWSTHSIGEQWFRRVRATPQESQRLPPWLRIERAKASRSEESHP